MHPVCFFFKDTLPTEIYTLSLHDALPICSSETLDRFLDLGEHPPCIFLERSQLGSERDRKSTRLNSSHTVISYAVFCLKKKKKTEQNKPQNETNSKKN